MTKTTMSGPMHLGLPNAEPVPMEGCGGCAALAERRRAARRGGDLSTVSDLNVRMRAHQGSGCA
ncbi:hypothetical protein SAMN04487983_102349 [Streptomyces sp. yr375]|uniref:hypothetical protein n=1 Tax=Streptomyces sp. yr375 TaxID=1761906 RepID=UPI0008C56A8D|nr:hypothetical protein [Streptomyces sp. yr375]SER83581.1 hypothetical protein SAMN04487983_102349 [Streptomyces sp. yr375]